MSKNEPDNDEVLSGFVGCRLSERGSHQVLEAANGISISTFPPRERARINANLGREIPLRHAEPFAMIDQTMRQSVTILKRIKAEKFNHSAKVIDAWFAVSFLPIDDAHLVAADHLGRVDLSKTEIKPALSDHLADALGVGWIPLHLCKVGADRATNHLYCLKAKWQ